MSKYISVPSLYVIYEVEDDVLEILNDGSAITPPQVILEVLMLQGKAKRLGTIGTVALDASTLNEIHDEEEDEEEDPPEGEGPWLT